MLQNILIVFIAGILYGLSVLSTQKVLFISKKLYLITIVSTLRLLLISIFFYIMLKSTKIHPIILITAFLIAYWLMILKFKELFHGK